MKRLVVFGCCLAAALLARAGVDNLVMSFSTPGPDCYRDGTPVRDGECYALVYTPSGATFGGIAADGTAVAPSVVALRAPVAKGGKCPFVQFQIDETYAQAHYPDGTWGVYLLDTRKYRTVSKTLDDGTEIDGIVVKDASGNPVVEGVGLRNPVNGLGLVGTPEGGRQLSLSVAGPKAVSQASTAEKGADEPKIVDFRVLGGNAYMKVRGTSRHQRYAASSASTLSEGLKPTGDEQYGAADGNETIIVVPATGESGFYSFARAE